MLGNQLRLQAEFTKSQVGGTIPSSTKYNSSHCWCKKWYSQEKMQMTTKQLEKVMLDIDEKADVLTWVIVYSPRQLIFSTYGSYLSFLHATQQSTCSLPHKINRSKSSIRGGISEYFIPVIIGWQATDIYILFCRPYSSKSRLTCFSYGLFARLTLVIGWQYLLNHVYL